MQPVEKLSYDENSTVRFNTIKRFETELKWIKLLQSVSPLTRCYTQHTLRPLIDSEIDHKRHSIKTHFINKGIDFIDLPSIFQDKSVTSSIPDYF